MRTHSNNAIVKNETENRARKSIEDAMRFQARPTNATMGRGSSSPNFFVRDGINLRTNVKQRDNLKNPAITIKRDVV